MSPPTPTNTRFALVYEHGGWRVLCDGKTVQMRESKGLRYLALLLANPGERLHVLEMVARVEERRSTVAVGETRPSLAGRERASDLREEIERARKRVAIAVRRAIGNLVRPCPELAKHLEQRLRLGASCEYHADRDSAVRFECPGPHEADLASVRRILHKGT